MSAEPLNQSRYPSTDLPDWEIRHPYDELGALKGLLHYVHRGVSLDQVIVEATRYLTSKLRVDEVDICTGLADQFEVVGGSGWLRGDGADSDQLLAYLKPQMTLTLLAGEPIIVTDLSCEPRFHVSRQLLGMGAVSSLSMLIGADQPDSGLIALLTQRRREFSFDDIRVVREVAGVLAEAMKKRTVADSGCFILRRYMAG